MKPITKLDQGYWNQSEGYIRVYETNHKVKSSLWNKLNHKIHKTHYKISPFYDSMWTYMKIRFLISRLVCGTWVPGSSELLKMSVTSKGCLVAAVLMVADKAG